MAGMDDQPVRDGIKFNKYDVILIESDQYIVNLDCNDVLFLLLKPGVILFCGVDAVADAVRKLFWSVF